MITPELLHRWAERLCRFTTGGRAEAAQVLDVTATLAAHRDYALVEPPPPDVARMRIFDDLATHSKLEFVDLELAPPGITLAALQAELGEGRSSVRVSATSPHRRWFEIEVEGAPSTCDIYASFPDLPSATSTTTAIMLRRNPSPAPKR